MFNFIKKIVRKVTDKTIKFQTQLLDFLKSFFKTTKEDAPKEETQAEESASTSTDESSKLEELVAAKTAEAGERAKAFDPHSTRQKARKTKPLRKANRKPRK